MVRDVMHDQSYNHSWTTTQHMKAFIILILSCSSLCTALAQSATNALIPWTRFEWVGMDVGTQHVAKAALLVPITLKGVDGVYYLQLDLGSDQTMLYEVPFRQVLSRAGRTNNVLKGTAVIDMNVAEVELPRFRISVRLKYGEPLTPQDPMQQIGTLGLDFFENHLLLLDYPAQRLAILPGDATLPADITKTVSFVPVIARNRKLFVPVTLNGKEYPDDFFFDTGTSLLPVVTTRSLWQQITGRTGDEPDNRVVTGPAWGDDVKVIGAPIQGEAQIGTVQLSHPLAYFVATGNDNSDFDKWQYKVKGCIGNAFFYEDCMVVIDLPHKRFGVIHRVQTEAK